ncbi:MAG TPA: carboxypeptidase regulatory-like domain-containing protein [Vicinamibacteria bacterium]|nr:carboxypeptidase regulatory-like domain-containing protein [Vicinamibacteria bacterium]
MRKTGVREAMPRLPPALCPGDQPAYTEVAMVQKFGALLSSGDRLKLWCRALAVVALCASLVPAGPAGAQAPTTGGLAGLVTDPQDQPVPGATVTALHEPSGTRYEATTRSDGRFDIPGMRVGGPYTVTASLSGFQSQTTKDVFVSLGVTNDLDFGLKTAAIEEEITVTAQADPVFSSARTGAATSVDREALATLPTISGRLESFARLSPQYSGGPFGGSFVGQDNRLNNITVDGSYFNNSFGLAGSPGERTGVAPIAVDAIEEVQINVAPYDVRQGNFVGAGVNTITRSGANSFRGSTYYWFRDEGLVGTEAGDLPFNPGTFDAHRFGAWLSGPIMKNKLFFFGSFEDESQKRPGTTFEANAGGQTVGGNTTRVLAADLDALSNYLASNFDFNPGPYEDYSFETPARRYLARVDYNFNDRNKFTVRYTHLDSDDDVLVSNSSSLGFGTRRSNTTGLNFQGSNYKILENIRSIVGEWNSIIGANNSNTLIVGYTSQDESRGALDSLFPMVDILQSGSVYTTFGSEPFTPNNELRYKTFQLQDSFTMHRGNHALTFGGSAERYRSENVFFPGSQSVYIYNSLADFYTDANGYLANPNRTTSPVVLNRFQVRWMNIPGLDKPVQPLEVWYTGIYAQDVWEVNRRLKVTYGLRLDVPFFSDTGFDNSVADAMTFRDQDGNPIQYSTAQLPEANILWSPRVGFNWDVSGDRRTQVRGGTGVFTGKPAYVWISNQIGNTGVLTGFEQLNNTIARPFHPDPNHYKPTTVTGAPASSFELALTDPNFKFPQVWRTNLAVDRRLPWNLVGTAEFLYTQDVNGVDYINANLPAANTRFNGADARPRWTAGTRINPTVANAVVLQNQGEGHAWHISGALQKAFRAGFLKAAYSYGEAKNTVDPGSIAFGSWNNNQHSGDPNNPGVAFSSASPGHRFFLAGSYRFEFLKFGATTLSAFWQGNTNTITGVATGFSYTYSGDLNGDGGTSNDLIYIPRDTSEMNFQTFTQGTRTFTAEEQAAAWEAYIQQDSYLSKHRGQYAERGAVFLPMVWRMDLSLSQDIFKDLGGKRHALQVRADVLNFSNLLNKSWGVGKRLVNNQPLIVPSSTQGGPADLQGRAQYRLRVVNNELMRTSFEPTAGIDDVYRVQFSLRYTFN